jgi:hypothetical protein
VEKMAVAYSYVGWMDRELSGNTIYRIGCLRQKKIEPGTNIENSRTNSSTFGPG